MRRGGPMLKKRRARAAVRRSHQRQHGDLGAPRQLQSRMLKITRSLTGMVLGGNVEIQRGTQSRIQGPGTIGITATARQIKRIPSNNGSRKAKKASKMRDQERRKRRAR